MDAPIIASMATIAGRDAQRRTAVASLLEQVDLLVVYAPETVSVTLTEHLRLVVRHGPDYGDAGKVAAVDDRQYSGAIRLLVDDDIVYPPDYVARMRVALDTHPGAVVGVHGKCVVGPITSYYRSLRGYHFTQALAHDTPVHVLGTGTVAYSTDVLHLHPTQFPVPNMADIWLALRCQRAAIPRVAIARPATWLRVLPVPTSIWDTMHRRDALQTSLMQAVDWPPLEN